MFYYHEREEYINDELVTTTKYKIVDDHNLPGETLAQRRLQLTVDKVPLAKLSNAVYFLGDLIKIADPKLWFIDSQGKIFNYKRTSRAKLKFYKISRLLPINTGGVVVEVENLSQRFKALYKPTEDKQYVGILHFGVALILYGFYDQKYDETWRMV